MPMYQVIVECTVERVYSVSARNDDEARRTWEYSGELDDENEYNHVITEVEEVLAE